MAQAFRPNPPGSRNKKRPPMKQLHSSEKINPGGAENEIA